MIIKRLRWAIEDKDWDAVKLLMSKIYQQIKSATPDVMESWVDMYYKIIDSRPFILFVMVVSNILYLLLNGIHKIVNYIKR